MANLALDTLLVQLQQLEGLRVLDGKDAPAEWSHWYPWDLKEHEIELASSLRRAISSASRCANANIVLVPCCFAPRQMAFGIGPDSKQRSIVRPLPLSQEQPTPWTVRKCMGVVCVFCSDTDLSSPIFEGIGQF